MLLPPSNSAWIVEFQLIILIIQYFRFGQLLTPDENDKKDPRDIVLLYESFAAYTTMFIIVAWNWAITRW